MRPETDHQPRAGEIVMSCAHSRGSAAPTGAQLIRINGGPRVFANLDDRFFSEWLYFCEDCCARVRASARAAADLIHGPMEWTMDREGKLKGSLYVGATRNERPRSVLSWLHG